MATSLLRESDSGHFEKTHGHTAEEILRELVACKDLKDAAAAEQLRMGYQSDKVRAMLTAYNRRKTDAWQAARKHIGGNDG